MEQNNTPTTPQDISTQPTTPFTVSSKQKLNFVKFAIVGVVGILLILGTAGFAYFLNTAKNPTACATVMTWARNTKTDECKEFPNSCLPDGWESDKTCDPTITPNEPDLSRDISNWKTYRNSVYGFEFKYPSRLREHTINVSEEDRKRVPSLNTLLSKSFVYPLKQVYLPSEPKEQKKFLENVIRVSLDIYDNPHNIPLEEFLRSTHSSNGPDGKTQIYEQMKQQGFLSTDIPIDKSILFEGKMSENYVKTYFFSEDSRVYEMQVRGGWGTGEKYSETAENEFDQILSTFKFVSKLSLDTSTWEPYSKLSQYAIFQTPPNWHSNFFGEGGLEGGTTIATFTSLPYEECNTFISCDRLVFQVSTQNSDNPSSIDFGDTIKSLKIGDSKLSGTQTYTRLNNIVIDGTETITFSVAGGDKDINMTFRDSMRSAYIRKSERISFTISGSDNLIFNTFIQTIKFEQ